MTNIKSIIRQNLINSRGWRTNRKIVVIESDDWGSIRMPNKLIYDKLKKTKLGSTLSIYDKLDSLERREDFQNLLELGSEFKDGMNNPLTFTLNTVMQNPNFEKIKATKYQKFFGVPFFQSYQQYFGEDLQGLWLKGIDEKIIKPQFHAREHLNEYRWLKDLRSGNKEALLAFEYDFFALKTETSSKFRKHYLATYFSETEEEFERVSLATIDGLKKFKNVFGYNSETFIASNYCWPKELEKVLKENGVIGLQTQFGNTITNFKRESTSAERFYTGQKNKQGQTYTVRNVIFEPYLNQNKDWIDSSLNEIRNSFAWKKPAIICMHRVNFVSEMNVENRDKNLNAFKNLISRLLKKFPEVEFMSSDKLIKLIENENSHS